MTSAEQFDDELTTLLNEGDASEVATRQAECDTQAVEEALWTALEQLSIVVSLGRDPAGYDDDFENLYQKILERVAMSPSDSQDTEEIRERKIALATHTEWDEDWRLLNAMGAALYRQQYTGLTQSEKHQLKKQAMADAYAGESEPSRWLVLYDRLLEGDPLNLETPADLALLEAAEAEFVNHTNRPIILLFGAVARALGVSPDSSEPLLVHTAEDVESRTFAARDIVEVAHQHAGDTQRPNRHEAIYAILGEYEVPLTPDEITTILQLADAYAK